MITNTRNDILRVMKDAGGSVTQAAGVERFGTYFSRSILGLARAELVEQLADEAGRSAWRLTVAGRKLRLPSRTRTPSAPRTPRAQSDGVRQGRGQGSITEHGGRFRVRAPDRRRTHLGFFATREEADAVLEAARRTLIVAEPPLAETTLAEYGARVLDERELAGYRSVDTERQHFKKHVEASRLGTLPVTVATKGDVREFVKAMARKPADDKRGARTISHHTVKRTLTIVSAVFAASVEKGYRDDNPAIGVKVHRPANVAATRETWSFLTLEEQRRLEAGPIPDAAKELLLFALGTGLRQGELWNLELADLHVNDDAAGGPHVMVRFGSKGKPPKNGKIRRVPLFGVGLAAARRWLELRPSFVRTKRGIVHGALHLVFPSPHGTRRQVGKFGRHGDLRGFLKACGIDRPFRFHDLRHSCASSLVSGFWGRTWTLHEVCAMLGHSSITVTERYAHVGQDFLTRAAAATPGTGMKPAAPSMTLEEARRMVAEADARLSA